MVHFFKILANFFLLLPMVSQARTPLFFPAEKNNVQILPQKFEYSLRNQSQFLLGNRIIDSEQFKFDLVFDSQTPQLNISWPANVVQEGRIIFTNPSGLNVWSQPISKAQTEIVLKDASTLVRSLASLSFFRFCVGYYDIDTGLDVCSPEIMIKDSGKNLSVSPRTLDQKPLVQINGRTVTHHGIVFLNDETESLSFRAISRSGAEFKMDTRRLLLKFLDVQEIDEKSFQLTVEGPLPLAPSNYKKISQNTWSVPLSKERALIYVPGEGQVPLRQEFIVLGPLPTPKHRVYLRSSANQKTYASTLSVLLEKGASGRLVATEPSSQVTASGNQFLWTVNDVPSGLEKTAYLGVQDQGSVFQAAYVTSRQDSARVELGLGLESDEMKFSAILESQLWFENAPLSYQKLGFDLYFDYQDAISSTQLFTLYRLHSGLQFVDASLYFGLGFQNWSFASKSVSTFSTRAGWVGPGPQFLPYFDWQEIDLRLTLPAEASDLKLKAAWLARWKLYHSLEDSQKFKVSVGLKSFESKILNSNSKTTSAVLEGAWVKTF